jgi:leucyl aminopeptidase
MKFTVLDRTTLESESRGACLVTTLRQDESALPALTLSEADRKGLEQLIADGVVTGKPGEAYYLATPASAYAGVAVVGVGEEGEAETFRRGAGTICGALKTNRNRHVVLDATGLTESTVSAFAEGLILGQYVFDDYKKPPDDTPVPVDELTVVVDGDAEGVQTALQTAVCAASNANWARDLANMPSNDLTPERLATVAAECANRHDCACEVLDEGRMRELGMDLILGVSQGSEEPARLICLKYEHPEAKHTIALVGKGITFDTGGISIKPSAAMHEMKYDMCGAAAVLGAFKTVCELKPVINVVCVVPAAENMLGSKAMTPGEILKANNGTTVEIQNTDAEGRLVLADALAYTIETYKPDCVVDLATLTGGVITALGHYAAGLFSNDDDLVGGLEVAGEATGERVWQLPLWDAYSELLKGTHGDISNMGPAREASSIVGAAFLEKFVDNTPWAHLDIAGTAWGGKNISYLSTDHATGYGVRLLTRWILDAAG